MMDKVTSALFGTVTVPKLLVIHNKRLGFLNLVLTVFFVGLALFNIFATNAYLMVSIPVEAGLAIWMDTDVSRSASTAHCSSPTAFHYDYSATYLYRPDRCQIVEPGEEYTKFPGSLFVPTYIADTHYNYSSGGRTEISDEFLVKDAEKQFLFISHGYQVPKPGFLGTSSDTETTSALTSSDPSTDILTVVLGTDGKACTVGGKAVWTTADMLIKGGIQGTVEDFITCAGKTLDDKGGQSYVSTSGTRPQYRIGGMSLTIHIDYYNAIAVPSNIKSDHPHDGVTGVLRVQANDVWTSEVAMGYAVPPGQGTNGNVATNAKFRRRYQSGISIKAQASGVFKEWNYNAMIAALVQALVFISLPATIIKPIAFKMVGLLSKIYTRVATEQLNVVTRLPGLAARLMSQAAAFRTLTKQDEKISRGMNQLEAGTYMQEAFHKQMESGMLDQKELDQMVSHMMDQLDAAGSGDISVDEFLIAASSNEAVSVEDLAKIYDAERKRGLGEKCLGNISGGGVVPTRQVVPVDNP
jgi:hypothetical protein